MALIRPAQPINTISGPLGGVTFRRVRSTPTPQVEAVPLPTPATEHPQARTSVVSVRRGGRRSRTAAQHRAANEARAAALAWRQLTDAEREQWETMAAALQINNRPDSVGLWAGWPLFSAVHRRFTLAGETPPTTPTFVGNPRVDRPWIKAWPSSTPGTINVFWEPVSTPYPEEGSVGCLYASPPRPATKRAIARRSVFVASFDPFLPRFVDDSLAVVVAAAADTPPGAVIDLKACTASANGEASAEWFGQVRFPPPGWGLAAMWWSYSFLGYGVGVELTADRLLRVWPSGYPTDAPDETDLLHPTEKSVGDVLTALSAGFFTDTRTIDGGLLGRPQSDLPVIPRQRWSCKKGPLLLFAQT